MMRLFDAYLWHLEAAVRLDPGVVCPGVRELLTTLSYRAHIHMALATGNLERGARLKLAVHGLDRYFETGGFGSDASRREAVIAAAIAKAEAHYGIRFQRVSVIGDTPQDVVCARANKVHSVGVATGPFGVDALQQSGAALVFADLSDTDLIVSALDGLPQNIRPSGAPHEESVHPFVV